MKLRDAIRAAAIILVTWNIITLVLYCNTEGITFDDIVPRTNNSEPKLAALLLPVQINLIVIGFFALLFGVLHAIELYSWEDAFKRNNKVQDNQGDLSPMESI